MKERIKKFYKENQEACVYAACLALVATTSTFIVRKSIDDMRIVAVENKLEDGVHWIHLVHKNGIEEFWNKTQEV